MATSVHNHRATRDVDSPVWKRLSLVAPLILSYLRGQLDEMVGLLEELVRAESPSHVPESQGPVLSMLATALGRLPYYIRRIPGRQTGGHLYARPAQRLRQQPTQLILGHSDTVWPLGTLKEMPLE